MAWLTALLALPYPHDRYRNITSMVLEGEMVFTSGLMVSSRQNGFASQAPTADAVAAPLLPADVGDANEDDALL